MPCWRALPARAYRRRAGTLPEEFGLVAALLSVRTAKGMPWVTMVLS